MGDSSGKSIDWHPHYQNSDEGPDKRIINSNPLNHLLDFFKHKILDSTKIPIVISNQQYIFTFWISVTQIFM